MMIITMNIHLPNPSAAIVQMILVLHLISFSWTIDLIIMDAEYTQARVMNMGKVLAMAMMNLSSM